MVFWNFLNIYFFNVYFGSPVPNSDNYDLIQLILKPAPTQLNLLLQVKFKVNPNQAGPGAGGGGAVENTTYEQSCFYEWVLF